MYTNPIHVKRGYTIKFSAKGYRSNIAMISKSNDGVIIPLVVSDDSTYKTYTYKATEDIDVVLSCTVNNGENCIIYIELSELDDKVYELDDKVYGWSKKDVTWSKGYCEVNGIPHSDGSYYEYTNAISIKNVKQLKIYNPYCGTEVSVVTFYSSKPTTLSNVCGTVVNTTEKYELIVDVPQNAACYIVSKVGTQNTKIYEYESSIDNIYRCANVNIVGDSYSTYDGFIMSGNWAWYSSNGNTVTNDVASLKDTWFYKVAKKLQCKILCNDSSSGTTVSTSVRNEGQEWSAMINRVKSTMGKDKAKSSDAKADLIIVFGGRNDYTLNVTVGNNKYADWSDEDKKQFAPTMCCMLDYLITYNPYAEIVVVSGSHLGSEYNSAIADACEHYKLKNIVLPNFELQGGHPSKNGMTTIANCIVNELLK